MEQPLQAILQNLQREHPNHPCVRYVEDALKTLRGGDLRQACQLVNEALECLNDNGITLPPGLVEWEKLYCGIE